MTSVLDIWGDRRQHEAKSLLGAHVSRPTSTIRGNPYGVSWEPSEPWGKMTLIVACAAKDGVVLASDSRIVKNPHWQTPVLLDDGVKAFGLGTRTIYGFAGYHDCAQAVQTCIQGKTLVADTLADSIQHISHGAVEAFSSFRHLEKHDWPSLEILIAGIDDKFTPRIKYLSTLRQFDFLFPAGNLQFESEPLLMIGVAQPLVEMARRIYTQPQDMRVALALCHFLVDQTAWADQRNVGGPIQMYAVSQSGFSVNTTYYVFGRNFPTSNLIIQNFQNAQANSSVRRASADQLFEIVSESNAIAERLRTNVLKHFI